MKTSPWIASAVLGLLAACGGETSQQTPAGTPSAVNEPPSAVDETLPTAEEEAAKADEAIDEKNADDELQKLQTELGGG